MRSPSQSVAFFPVAKGCRSQRVRACVQECLLHGRLCPVGFPSIIGARSPARPTWQDLHEFEHRSCGTR
eukprot:11440766-Alexandrium_andersonii.AAC.1